MKDGNWVPISKKLIKALPDDRPYSEVEAMFSLTVDYDCGRTASVAGYSKLWQWSRKKVTRFLKNAGVEIKYIGHKYGQKKGQVGLQVGDRLGTGKAQVVFVDSKGSSSAGDRLGTGEAQVRDRLGNTTIKPNPNPKEKSIKKKKSGNGIFKPPTVQMVTEYCLQRKNGVDPEKFIDHYTARGWSIKGSKIKDWRACVRTWERSGFNNATTEEDSQWELEYKKASQRARGAIQ